MTPKCSNCGERPQEGDLHSARRCVLHDQEKNRVIVYIDGLWVMPDLAACPCGMGAISRKDTERECTNCRQFWRQIKPGWDPWADYESVQ